MDALMKALPFAWNSAHAMSLLSENLVWNLVRKWYVGAALVYLLYHERAEHSQII